MLCLKVVEGVFFSRWEYLGRGETWEEMGRCAP